MHFWTEDARFKGLCDVFFKKGSRSFAGQYKGTVGDVQLFIGKII